MNTENAAPTTDLIVHPATGEVIDLNAATTTELAAGIEAIRGLLDDLNDFRRALINELAGRLDKRGARSAVVGDIKLTTNAPTQEHYDPTVLKAALLDLADEDLIEPELVDEVVKTVTKTVTEVKVDKRLVNNLKRSDDDRIKAAVTAATSISHTNRTISIERTPSR